MFSVVILARSISAQNTTRGQGWELEDAAFAWPDSRDKGTKNDEYVVARLLEGERADLGGVAAGRRIAAYPTDGAAASIVAVPCRRARGTWRRKPFEVAEEVALARARVE